MKKRLLTLLLVFAMCFALTVPAFAGANEPDVRLSSKEMMEVLQSMPVEIAKPESADQARYWSGADWFLDESKEDVFRKIADQVETLTKGRKTETDRARAIYKWVADNVTYDYTALEIFEMGQEERTDEQLAREAQSCDALYTFINRRAVCSGYTNLVNLMLTMAGLPAAGFGGAAKDGGAHAWSAVYADKKWIIFDTTWNKWNIGPNYHQSIEDIYFPCGYFLEIIRSNGEVWGSLMTGYDHPSDIVIPEYVTGIGEWGFSECTDVTSVTIPDNVTSIGYAAFYNCTGLTSAVIPNSVTSIGEWAFSGCKSLTAAAIPDSATDIGAYAFHGCTSLTSAVIPSSVAEIKNSVFQDCTGLTSLTISSGTVSIGEWAFSGCKSLTSVTIPSSVTSIGYAAFYDCASLTSVIIPKSVTSIAEWGISGCPALKDVYFTGSEAQWGAVLLADNNYDLTAAAIHCNSAGPARSARLTNDIMTVNGEAVKPTAYKINDSNYFKLRDVAALLNGSERQFNVDYDGALNAVIITTGQGYHKLDSDLQGAAAVGSTALPSTNEVYIDGERVEMTAYNINGSNYFQLRELGRKLDFNVGWNEAERYIFIEGGKPYTDAD